MVITLCRLIPFAAGHRRRARWNLHIDVIAVRRDRLVSGVTIIRAIRRHSGNPVFNLIQQRHHLGWIVGVLIRQGLRHDHAASSIDRQVQFTPFPARLRAMLRLQPLARPVDLQSSTIDQNVQRAYGTCAGWIPGNLTARRLTVV